MIFKSIWSKEYKTYMMMKLLLVSLLTMIVFALTLRPTYATLNNIEELPTFVDAFAEAQMDGHNIPGIMVSIVSDGKIIYAKGYGYANLDTREKMDANHHLVPIASTSKLFVATAVMQQVDAGKLDLDADINQYLDGWELKNPYGGPVTLRHLLTHTAGFEDKHFLVAYTKELDTRPREEQLSTTAPKFIYAPGKYSSYSNYGIALAGMIAAKQSGMSYEDYIQKNIFDPLGMTSTTTYQPIPPALKERLAEGYITKGDIYTTYLSGYFNTRTAPAGRVQTTANDISIFMNMLLNRGEYNGVRIVSAESVDEMTKIQFSPHAELPGMGLAFYEKGIPGARGIGHGGDGLTHHTDLTIFPEENTGLFVAYMSNKGADVRNELLRAFTKKFVAQTDIEFKAKESVPYEYFDDIIGQYRWLRVNFTTIEKLAQFEVKMMVKPFGENMISFGSNLGQRVFAHVGDGVFESPFDGQRIVFEKSEEGPMIAKLGGYAFMTAYNLEENETQEHFMSSAQLLTIIFAAGVLAFIISIVISPTLRQNGLVYASLILALSGGIFFPGAMMIMGAYGLDLYIAVPTIGYVWLAIPYAGMLIAAITIYFLVKSFTKGESPLWLNISSIIMLLSYGYFVYFLNFWNLLGYRFA